MVIEVKRIEKSWKYEVPGFGVSHIEVATLGKNKGKTFLISEDYTKVAEINVIEKHTVRVPFNEVNVADKIEIVKENLSFEEIFFEVARKTKFAIEDGNEYEGYTFNRYWNGWECPMFEFDIAMEILHECEKRKDEEGALYITYDKENDTFFYHCNDEYEEDAEPYGEKGHDILGEDGKIHHVYDIGACSWIWSEVSETENEESEE